MVALHAAGGRGRWRSKRVPAAPPPPPAPHAPTKPGQGAKYSWKDTRNNPDGGRGVRPPHSGASPARPPGVPHTRVHAHVPTGRLRRVCAGRAAQAGRAPCPQLLHMPVCLPKRPERLSSPAASEEQLKPGVWARVKSCTIFSRLSLYAQYAPASVYVCGCAHTVTHNGRC